MKKYNKIGNDEFLLINYLVSGKIKDFELDEEDVNSFFSSIKIIIKEIGGLLFLDESMIKDLIYLSKKYDNYINDELCLLISSDKDKLKDEFREENIELRKLDSNTSDSEILELIELDYHSLLCLNLKELDNLDLRDRNDFLYCYLYLKEKFPHLISIDNHEKVIKFYEEEWNGEEFLNQIIIMSNLFCCESNEVFDSVSEGYEEFLYYTYNLLVDKPGYFLNFPETIFNLVDILQINRSEYLEGTNTLIREVNALKILPNEKLNKIKESFLMEQMSDREKKFYSLEELRQEIIYDAFTYDFICNGIVDESRLYKDLFVSSTNYLINKVPNLFDEDKINNTKKLLSGGTIKDIFFRKSKSRVVNKLNKLDRGCDE